MERIRKGTQNKTLKPYRVMSVFGGSCSVLHRRPGLILRPSPASSTNDPVRRLDPANVGAQSCVSHVVHPRPAGRQSCGRGSCRPAGDPADAKHHQPAGDPATVGPAGMRSSYAPGRPGGDPADMGADGRRAGNPTDVRVDGNADRAKGGKEGRRGRTWAAPVIAPTDCGRQ